MPLALAEERAPARLSAFRDCAEILEQDSKRLNRKGDSHERGIVIQDSGWGEGASILNHKTPDRGILFLIQPLRILL